VEARGIDMGNRLACAFAGIVIVATTLVYLPVLHAQFVWDDVLDFVQKSWLSHGDDWKHYVFRDFNDWKNYFRPLVVALFTLQIRLFNGTPGPMHAVSLALHLINTLLVGVAAWRVSEMATDDARKNSWLPGLSMAIYGLHPVLTEAVTWIGCQFDLVATMFMLLGLLASMRIQSAATRATVIALLFFLAACSKESAAAFPLILVIFDWAVAPQDRESAWLARISAFAKRNGLTYAAIFLAGIAYLAFRHWALGQIVRPTAGHISAFARLQEACFIYLQYWKMLLWPMNGASPIHEVDLNRFNAASLPSLFNDATALCIAGFGLYFSIKRYSPIACIVAVVTVALLPVLRILSIDFTPSLYHERYAITALAVACTMLPLVRISLPTGAGRARLFRSLCVAIAGLWFVCAAIDIRTIVPLWSNDVSLWQWALVSNPHSVHARDNLLSAYIAAHDYDSAHKLIDQLRADHVQCANCMLNAAILAVGENDPTRAQALLEDVRTSREVANDKQMFYMYLVTTGRMLLLQGHLGDAEGVFRSAVEVDPLDSQSRIWLATSLAMQGKLDEARKMGESSISLLPPDKRDSAQKALDQLLHMVSQPSSTANPATNDQ
jgi:protein O-mannosyl-transferase